MDGMLHPIDGVPLHNPGQAEAALTVDCITLRVVRVDLCDPRDCMAS
jgi:hypothetical protein